MFRNVLVGVDGGWGGADAVALASRLVGGDGKLHLVHVRAGELHPLHAVTPGLLAEEHRASEALLEKQRAQSEVDAELTSLVAMSPGRGLHELAEARQADLIVVGSYSRGFLGRAMLGDDARTALNGAPCAIAIAARGYGEHPVALARLGVGYDDSDESRSALEAAKELAASTHARVVALEVVSIPSYAYAGLVPPALGESIDLMIKQADERMAALEGVEGRAVYGVTGEELAAFSAEVDLLLMGSRNYGPLRRVVVGSTSDYLERHARCSLLVLPRRHGS